jgi:HAMP domain-containing protein
VITTFKKSFYKNGYLLIIAAWLYTISFIFSNYQSYTSSPKRVKHQLESYLKEGEDEFRAFTNDTPFLKEIVEKTIVPKKSVRHLREDLGLFVYTGTDPGKLLLHFWSNNKMAPDIQDLSKPDGKYFSQNTSGQFEFIKKTFYLKNQIVVTTALIPIHWSYFFNNEYLQSEFPAISGISKRYDIAASGADVYIKNGEGKVLFGLKEKTKSADERPGGWTILFRVLSLVFVLIFINVYAFETVNKKGWVKGFVFLAASVFLFRFVTYVFPFAFELGSLELFQATIYASNYVNKSLGDLFINVMLLFWLISFVKFSAEGFLKNVQDITGKRAWIVQVVLCLSLIVLSFASASVIRSLISDSKISFDVKNPFSLNFYSFFSLIILCFITLTFFHLSHLALLFIHKSANVPTLAKYFIVAVGGLIYLSFNLHDSASIANLVVLIWLLIYMGIMEFRKEDIFVPILRSSFFLIWIIFFAASISALIIYQNRYEEFERRKRLADEVISQVDPFAETFMSIEIENIDSAFLSSSFENLKYESTNKLIKDSLINANFSGYLNKYDTRLYTFDHGYHPLYNDDSVTFDNITNIIYNRSKKTFIEGLYYYENEFTGFSYLYEKEIVDSSNNIVGYFFVVAEPKKYKSQALTPELFKQVKDIEADLDVNYAYAVYNKGVIINTYGDYNFKSYIPRNQYPKQEFKEEEKKDSVELWYNAGNNKLVIIVKAGSVSYEAITLFAYLFGSFLFVVIMFQVLHYLISNKFRITRLRNGLRLNIRNQVQGTIIFISIFSFLVIGIATISFYINRFRQTNRERLVKAMQIMTNEIQSRLASRSALDDVANIYDLGANNNFERSIREISEIHNVDVNFYNVSGNLKVSTQPYIYKKQILSDMMEPTAFFRLHYENNIRVIQEEQVSHFSFISIYMPVKDERGEIYGYVNIPYLNSQKELKQEISNFLVTLINLNAFIFVIAGAIAVFLTNRITGSFILIASKMRAINLGTANEEIAWNTNDEIGALVNEYNKMVKKLEESAHALAKSEREGAWREMARQVAHEIKNPLTPMKLSIQYLQRAIKERNPNIEILSQKYQLPSLSRLISLQK